MTPKTLLPTPALKQDLGHFKKKRNNSLIPLRNEKLNFAATVVLVNVQGSSLLVLLLLQYILNNGSDERDKIHCAIIL